MSSTRKRWILSIGGLSVVAVVLAALLILLPDDGAPAPAARPPSLTAVQVGDKFLAALAARDAAGAAALTTDQDTAKSVLAATFATLEPAAVTAEWTGMVPPAADAAEVSEEFRVSWTLGPGRVWSYGSALTLARAEGQWRVRWAPTVVHPSLTPGHALVVRGSATDRTAVLDRDGQPLMSWQGGEVRPVDPAVAPLLAGGMKRLAGPKAAEASRIVLVDGGGAEVTTLFGVAAAPTAAVTSTLSVPTQRAAQAAVDTAAGPALVVAIQPSTGDILAVAQNRAAGDAPKALNGLYPPGSTFKVVTAAAVLGAGKATIDTVLPCPGSQTIGTRAIKNADFELGQAPLRTAFAQSCNTTFAALAADLPADLLPRAAAQFGLAADFEIPGLATQTGRVRPAGGTPEQVENSIGQGTVQASPFGLALMTATVAKGSAVTPRLFAGIQTVVKTGYQGPSAGTVGALRTMMREVVTSGRGRALAGYGPVAGKTGTAQFGDGTRSHGWFAGYRGDVAFAVLVEDAGAAAPAVAVTGKFLAGLS
ncbi:penicillin-binding transpeptidase domain-containing protein [Actinokineospora sp.]|uniref:penicillin-binding transpeptidase domain-containing protein n=1 Tax=Actinokineospora sp. TaxID=1872133 RepID=UPI004037AC4F